MTDFRSLLTLEAVTDAMADLGHDRYLEGGDMNITSITLDEARQIALNILNTAREEEGKEPLERCPRDAALLAQELAQEAIDGGWGSGDEKDDETDDDDADEEEENNGRSIVKKSYKRAYKPFKQTCGDELSSLIAAHVKVKVEGESRPRIDPDKLERFAKANGCWVADYRNLNIGQQRMNIGNRLRKLVKDGHQIVWA